MPDFSYEQKHITAGHTHVAGLDEVGRGPLAGPVTAAAVILNPDHLEAVTGLDDSKVLSPKKRAAMEENIKTVALAWAVVDISPAEIDQINILQASLKAMREALGQLKIKADVALVDGNKDPGLGVPTECIVKGDGKSLSIAAASVLAKEHRDRLMKEYAETYPGYGFAGHKGYPSKLHREAIRQLGPCAIHRMSFTLLPEDR